MLVTVIGYVPAVTCGEIVPEITPVSPLIDNPSGRFCAAKPVPAGLAAMV